MIINSLQQSFKFPLYFKNWWTAYLDYFKVLSMLKVKEVLYEFKSGEKLYARPEQFDIGILNEVFIANEYQRPEYDIVIRNTDVVIDAGGYIGDFSIYAGKRANRGVVYVFEPSKDNYFLTKKNVELNKFKNIFIYNKGLYKESGKIIFHLNKKALGSSSLYPVERKNGEYKKERIRVIAINYFIKLNKIKRIDYLKLDCEGAEDDIIYSLHNNILTRIRCIVMEYHESPIKKRKKYSKIKLARYLQKFGFKVYLEKVGYLFCRNKNVQ